MSVFRFYDTQLSSKHPNVTVATAITHNRKEDPCTDSRKMVNRNNISNYTNHINNYALDKLTE